MANFDGLSRSKRPAINTSTMPINANTGGEPTLAPVGEPQSKTDESALLLVVELQVYAVSLR